MLLGLAAFSSLLILSCSKKNGDDNGGTTPPANNTSGPLFTAVKTMMQTSCAISGCHAGSNAQNGINFSVDNTIVAQKTRIKVRAVDQAGTSTQMPPSGQPLPLADRQKITDWINAGGRTTD
jgi:uncharacterized membrane protein